MKKLLALTFILMSLSFAVSAQGIRERVQKHRIREGFRSGQITRPERFELRKDQFRYQHMQRRVHRDGVVTPMERRRLHKQKAENRRQQFRYMHNRQRRVI
jgi:hypothetical protein